MAAPRITLYTTPACPHCRQAKRYLQRMGLRFQDFDIQNSSRAKRAFVRLGARGVPVIIVGETRIDGFDRKRLDGLLKP